MNTESYIKHLLKESSFMIESLILYDHRAVHFPSLTMKSKNKLVAAIR